MSDSAITFISGGVAEGTSMVYVTRLRGCTPNPLGRATTVSYELAHGGSVALSVHDVSGRLVRRLEDGYRSAGPHAVKWNGTDGHGRAVPAGVYFVRFSANGVTQSRRLTLVR
jgi:flagellar hook assembly protein FlgD